MGQGELMRWMRFEEAEPFLPTRLDVVGGLICALMANIHRNKNIAPFDTVDFMPFYRMQQEQREKADMAARFPNEDDREEAELQRMVLSFGGRIVH